MAAFKLPSERRTINTISSPTSMPSKKNYATTFSFLYKSTVQRVHSVKRENDLPETDRIISFSEFNLLSNLRHELDLSERVIRTLFHLNRSHFVPNGLNPYLDIPQPIGFNATISAPHIHAVVLKNLEQKLQPGNRILDIGSGSGYLTAAFGLLVGPTGKVIGVDHVAELIEMSVANITSSKAAKLIDDGVIEFHCSDGRLGWLDGAPYDAIHVGGALLGFPEKLLSQLKCGGRLVAPVEGPEGQVLCAMDKEEDGFVSWKILGRVWFIPMTDEDFQRQRYFPTPLFQLPPI